MVVEKLAQNVPSEVVPDFILEIGKIGLWLQALGILIIFWIIFQVSSLWINRKQQKVIHSMKTDLKRIEHKIDLLRKK
jgi:hypothetical protein